MTTHHSICESVQFEISNALDDQHPIPPTALSHVASCSECGAFLNDWSGDGLNDLGSPLPAVGLELFQQIRALPSTFESVSPPKHRFRPYISTAVAAVVLGVCGYSLLEIRPAETRSRSETALATQEINALKSDLRRSLGVLKAPAGAVQRVLTK